jgi:HAD superfamily hydrolase (TIGR01549 family)
MVDILGAEGVRMAVDDFQRVELGARRILHERIEEGSQGTEPELWGQYFHTLFIECGVPDERTAAVGERVRYEHRSDHLWTFALPHTSEVIDRLRDGGYRVGVISNADGRMEGALEVAGVRDHVEFVIDSEVVGVAKPDPKIFEAGCSALDLPPDACVYVGDLYPVDYVGARAAGLDAVLLDPLGLHADRADTVADLAELPSWLAGRVRA